MVLVKGPEVVIVWLSVFAVVFEHTFLDVIIVVSVVTSGVYTVYTATIQCNR